MKLSRAVATSFVALTLAAAGPGAHALSLASILHLHSHLATSNSEKAVLHIKNPNVDFRDVQVGSQVYTIRPNQTLRIEAPVGTPVYAACRMFHKHAKGALLAQVETGSHTFITD